jgi:hypothetical protein
MSEIREPIQRYKRELREDAEVQRSRDERAEWEKRKAYGELLKLREEFKPQMERIDQLLLAPKLPQGRRQPEKVGRLLAPLPPLVLTKDQIAARLDAERAEICRYIEAAS